MLSGMTFNTEVTALNKCPGQLQRKVDCSGASNTTNKFTLGRIELWRLFRVPLSHSNSINFSSVCQGQFRGVAGRPAGVDSTLRASIKFTLSHAYIILTSKMNEFHHHSFALIVFFQRRIKALLLQCAVQKS